MKSFKTINRILLENDLNHDGIKCHVVEEVRDRLRETAKNRNALQLIDTSLYCGIEEEDFEDICSNIYWAYVKSENNDMTINALTCAVIELYDNKQLKEATKYDVYELAEKYI